MAKRGETRPRVAYSADDHIGVFVGRVVAIDQQRHHFEPGRLERIAPLDRLGAGQPLFRTLDHRRGLHHRAAAGKTRRAAHEPKGS